MQKRSSGSVTVWFLDGPKVVEELRRIAQELIASDSRVEEVILFGSLAKGNYTPRSDADLCIILQGPDDHRPMDRVADFQAYFTRTPVPVDLLVYTREEVEQMRREGRRFVVEALEKGVTLASSLLGHDSQVHG